MNHHTPALLSFQAIHAALADSAKTREPMNALAVWTELGRGLAGTLEKKGASPQLLHDVVADYCRGHGREGVDLTRWAYVVPKDQRLTRPEVAATLRRVMKEIETRLPELAAQAETETAKERELFMTVVRGWFPVGLDIIRALPAAATASEADRLGALGAWCDRYLPKDTSAPRDLGVRMAKE